MKFKDTFKDIMNEDAKNLGRLTDAVGSALSNLKIEVTGSKSKERKKVLQQMLRAFDDFRLIKD